MYYERKFEFQIAARKRAAGDQLRSGCPPAAMHPPQGSAFLAASTRRTLPKLGRSSSFTIHKSRVASHRILIVTPRLEFPARATKQSLERISNRYKTAVFSSESPVHARSRREPSPPEFPWAPWRLIANPELEFFLNIAKSIKYKFLIANNCGFSVRCGGSRFRDPESLFAGLNLTSENRSTILASRAETRGIATFEGLQLKLSRSYVMVTLTFSCVRWLPTAQARYSEKISYGQRQS